VNIVSFTFDLGLGLEHLVLASMSASSSRLCLRPRSREKFGLSWHRWLSVQVNSVFYPSGVGESSTGLSGWGWGRACSPVSGGISYGRWRSVARWWVFH